ncbi:MAG: hypothetical protein OEQ18_10515 [Gammaproteobacteria bacterium]|nr:hypothetical protein [Gammaproteobacteria bacterium]MDH5535375.1 hypothetical protein [Betaproteobacteria bacterium]
MNAWSILLGAIVTGVLSYGIVPWLISRVDAQILVSLRDCDEVTQPRPPGGEIIGHLECAIFFASFVFMGVLLAAAWLVFKTAATWKIWESLKEVSHTDIEVKYRSS